MFRAHNALFDALDWSYLRYIVNVNSKNPMYTSVMHTAKCIQIRGIQCRSTQNRSKIIGQSESYRIRIWIRAMHAPAPATHETKSTAQHLQSIKRTCVNICRCDIHGDTLTVYNSTIANTYGHVRLSPHYVQHSI